MHSPQPKHSRKLWHFVCQFAGCVAHHPPQGGTHHSSQGGAGDGDGRLFGACSSSESMTAAVLFVRSVSSSMNWLTAAVSDACHWVHPSSLICMKPGSMTYVSARLPRAAKSTAMGSHEERPSVKHESLIARLSPQNTLYARLHGLSAPFSFPPSCHSTAPVPINPASYGR